MPSMPPHTYADAVAAFLHGPAQDGWARLPFFRDGVAETVAAKVDARVAAGAAALPAPADVFNALALTPLSEVKVVILGQDPYPTPGDAHGLAFSVRPGRRIPGSLRNIFKEMQSDLGEKDPGFATPANGTLTRWAQQGVLLINTVLTVEAGQSGAHRRFGWERLIDDMLGALAAHPQPIVFILWGNDARARRALVERAHHHVIESPHPSPLSARTGFFGSRPFSRANDFLEASGRGRIDWRLDP
jgi:uracil-DNA glycosylase